MNRAVGASCLRRWSALLAGLGVWMLVAALAACGTGPTAAVQAGPSPTTPPTPTTAKTATPSTAPAATTVPTTVTAVSTESPSAVPTPTTPAATPEPQPTAEGPAGLERVAEATIRIVSQGTFEHPQFGKLQNAAGEGSGFLISADGLAVTANHVVTGAASLNVYVPGRREPVNARIVGASECSDLAVIELAGGGYPFLEFRRGAVAVGTRVFAAGYALGEPEYTLVAGIVSKWDAAGDTSWASVDQVIQHDAQVNPGNSGGPLVTEDGRVVGIVFAGRPQFNQYFAVGLDVALPVLEELLEGLNVDWIGINGEAVSDGAGLTGLWVASVESGSPADEAGIRPGDIVIEFERLTMAADGTMKDYCDVLRTKGPTGVLQVKVLRPESGEVLEGQVNGRPLAVTLTVAVAPTPTPAARPVTPTATPTPAPTAAPALDGVAFDLSAAEARERAAAGSYGAPPVFPAGRRVFAGYRVTGLSAGTETRWVLTRDGAPYAEGTALTQQDGDDVIVAAVDQPLGFPGGRYRIEVFVGDDLLGSGECVVDTLGLTFANLRFATAVDERNLPVSPAHEFPVGTRKVYATFEIYNVPAGQVVTVQWVVNGVLWHNTPITVSESPTATVTVLNQHVGDPAFAPDGYHIGPGSAALDVGVNAGVGIDVDRQPRPYQMPDLGADEYWPPGVLKYIHLPLVLRSH